MKKLLLKTKKFKAIVFVILCLVTGLNVKAQTWPWIYDGSVTPDAATPAWTAGDAGTVLATYSIVNESGNNVLYETTTASGDKKSFKLPSTVIKQPKSATWLIRTKAGNKATGIEFELNSKNGASVTRGYFRLANGAGGGVLKTNYLTGAVTSYPMDSTLDVKNYHTYRITVENNTDYKIYLDENAAPIITGTGATTTNTQFLRIGDVGSNFTEGYIDWMAWDTTGAYPPSATLPAGVTVDNIPFPSIPAAPTANAATNASQTTVTANWASSAGATSYIIDVATDAGFSNLVTGYNNKMIFNVTTYNITGLTASTAYYYRVRAYNIGGTSSSSNTISLTTAAIPPTAPVAADGSNITKTGFSANWNTSAGATGYYLDVATDAGFTNILTGYNNKDVANVTTYAITGLAAGTTYYYQVRAYNTSGTSTSSGPINLTTLANAPAAPVATAASNIAQTGFSANWNASATATGYYLDVAKDASFTNFVTGYNNKDVANVTTYAVTGLTAGTTYYYQVRAYNSGTSASSNAVNLTTLPATPDAPVIADATNIAKTSFTANWAASAGATGYKLDVATDANFNNLLSNYTNIDVTGATSLSVIGLTAATTYYYRVRAYNTGGTSANSASKSVLSLGTGIATIDASSLNIIVKIGLVEISSIGRIDLVKVSDIQGITVSETKINSTNAIINTSSLSSGIYIFTIKTGNQVITKKLSLLK